MRLVLLGFASWLVVACAGGSTTDDGPVPSGDRMDASGPLADSSVGDSFQIEIGAADAPDEATSSVAGETCGNGVDDNGNGEIDEGCPCLLDGKQPCYPASLLYLDKGACRMGTQTCVRKGEFLAWGPCEGAVVPRTEICEGSVDDDCDGRTDNGCDCRNDDIELCGSNVGACKQGTRKCVEGKWGPCTGEVGPQPETCNGVDDDCDGVPDPGCTCIDGSSRNCGSTVGACRAGTQTCVGGQWGACTGGVRPVAEICGNGIDDNCNGQVDEGCVVNVDVNVTKDCDTIACPAYAPYPVGCNLTFSGGDSRGCVANQANQSTVFLKEGNDCGAGRVTGRLLCSNTPGGGLNASNCPINKKTPIYVQTSDRCPR
jgi:hypothetical protein